MSCICHSMLTQAMFSLEAQLQEHFSISFFSTVLLFIIPPVSPRPGLASCPERTTYRLLQLNRWFPLGSTKRNIFQVHFSQRQTGHVPRIKAKTRNIFTGRARITRGAVAALHMRSWEIHRLIWRLVVLCCELYAWKLCLETGCKLEELTARKNTHG